jgi:hypothetical protein
MTDPNLPTETDKQPEPVTTPQPVSEPTVPPTPPLEPAADPAQPPIDYEKKFAESTREAQILAAQLEAERAKSARRELTNEPTDSDLRAAFPEWEYMSEPEKRSATMAFKADRRSAQLEAEREAEKAERSWQNDLELAVAAHPELGAKAREFKDYASKPSHRGAPVDVLIKAFLHDTPAPPPATPSTPALEQGNGGPRTIEKPKLISPEELKTLRESDPNGYREYVKNHDLSQLDI